MARRLAFTLLLLLPACARPQACAPGTGAPMLIFNLYFGQAIAGRGDVTGDEWQRFQKDTMTRNLPNGYTLSDGAGAWMNPATHQTVHEATRVLTVALPEDAASIAAVNRVRTAYEERFHQKLVGMTTQPGCGVF